MDIFRKLTGEAISYIFDFTNELASGETLTSVTGITQKESGVTTSDLTIGTPALATPLVTALVSVGVAGKIYVMECKAVTSGGQTLIVEGGLAVK